MQSQVRFNRVPEQGPERSSSTWYRARPDSKGFRTGEGSGEGSGRLWCRARSGLTGFPEKVLEKAGEALVQSQVRFNRVPEKVPAAGFAARFRKICKNKTLRLLGIPPKLISLYGRWYGSVVHQFEG